MHSNIRQRAEQIAGRLGAWGGHDQHSHRFRPNPSEGGRHRFWGEYLSVDPEQPLWPGQRPPVPEQTLSPNLSPRATTEDQDFCCQQDGARAELDGEAPLEPGAIE
jgi:hypothetical protein